MNLIIRRARESDVPIVGRFALELTRQHQSYNGRRFVGFDHHEKRLFEFFRREIQRAESVVLVADLEDETIGYAFVRVEEASLIEISAKCAWLHDIYVSAAARGLDAGRKLLDAAAGIAREELGSNVLMLHVAPQNERARKIFEACGFEPTMTEMMLDLSARQPERNQ